MSTKWAYFAGIIDGEGCVRIGWGNYRADGRRTRKGFLQVGNTSKALVEWLKTHIGGNYYVDTANRATAKEVYVWQISCRDAAEALRNALPYLVIKREQAKILISFAQTLTQPQSVGKVGLPDIVHSVREVLAQAMHVLNGGGIPLVTEKRTEL